MLSARVTLRLALASLVSGAAAGLLLALCVQLAERLASPAPPAAGALPWYDWIEIGLILGLLFASAPAFFAGSFMWALSSHRPGARRPAAWAAAGAAVGAAAWAVVEQLPGIGHGPPSPGPDLGFLAACLPSGAGAALAFRLAIRLSLGLRGDLAGLDEPARAV